MGHVFLVRHGQASFGADDYDQLSALGQQQSIRLGEYWRERGMALEAVLIGSLKRHRQTWEGIQLGLQDNRLQPLMWPGLNEYDSEAVIHCIHPAPLPNPTRQSCTNTISDCCAKACKSGCTGAHNQQVCRLSKILSKASAMHWRMCAANMKAMCWWSPAVVPYPRLSVLCWVRRLKA